MGRKGRGREGKGGKGDREGRGEGKGKERGWGRGERGRGREGEGGKGEGKGMGRGTRTPRKMSGYGPVLHDQIRMHNEHKRHSGRVVGFSAPLKVCIDYYHASACMHAERDILMSHPSVCPMPYCV